jgi:general nucleoside transport system ATP-binding protein
MALLSMLHIRKTFAGVVANDDVCLDVEAGEIHALLGENGAGKTTLMNVLYGIYAPDEGEVIWKDEALTGHTPREAIQRGIGMVHQHFMLVPTLTVSQNITLGLRSEGHPFPRRKRLDRSIREISRTYGLEVDPAAQVSSLSVGEQQRVEIMKLLYRKADILVLDEPTAVLTPGEAESLFAVLRRLREEGHAVILITHRIPEVLEAANRITVLRDGRKVADLDARAAAPEELSRLMIGRALTHAARTARQDARSAGAPAERPGLAVDGLRLFERGLEKLTGVSLSVARGEILGVAGVDGNGQKELAECILGLRRPGAGTVLFGGRRVDRMTVAQRKKLGLAYVSDDRHRDGLVLEMDLAENFLLRALAIPGFSRHGIIDRRKCRTAAEAAISDYGIKTTGAASAARLLSGGNQQKLILARELAGSPSVIVASQPTRGLDVGATEFIRERLLACRATGAAVLLVSIDLDEILALSDRIVVMHRGTLSPSVDNGPGVDMTRLGLLMAGHASAAEGPQ